MGSVKNSSYPINLLSKIGNGKWNYQLPKDIDSTIKNILVELDKPEFDLITYRFKYKPTCKEISEKLGNMTSNQISKKIDKIIRRIHSIYMERLIMGDEKYSETFKDVSKMSFQLAVPFRPCIELRLRSNNINSLQELLNLSYDDLLRIPRIGEKTANDIVKTLSLNGYSLTQSKNPSLFHEYCKRLWEI